MYYERYEIIEAILLVTYFEIINTFLRMVLKAYIRLNEAKQYLYAYT